MQHHRNLTLLVSSLLLLAPLTTLWAGQSIPSLTSIEQAIAERGARWSVRPNWVYESDRTQQKRLLGAPAQALNEMTFLPSEMKALAVPDQLDWHNVSGIDFMSPVTNQGQCGSCVAFASMATLEGQLNVTNNLPNLDYNLSEQHIWACGGSGGCERGWYTSSAASYLKSRGVPDEACFPYTSGANGIDVACSQSCSNASERTIKISSYRTIGSSFSGASTQELISALQTGPLMASMTVYEDFMAYGSGIYEHVTGPALGGHAVTLVGYNIPESYWIVKNSWSADWGEKGYFRIKMDDDSNIGPGSIKMAVPAQQGMVKILEPVYRQVIDNGYAEFKVETNYPQVEKMTAKLIGPTGSAQTIELAAIDATHYQADLNTATWADGIYQMRVSAQVKGGNTYHSSYERFFILNGTPTLNTAIKAPAEGAVLNEKTVIEINSPSAPIPVQKLTLTYQRPDGTTKQITNYEPATLTKISWKTSTLENGIYKLWSQACIAKTCVESAPVSVKVQH